MAVFSPQPLKMILLDFFVKVTPPPQEESKCKNAQILLSILKDDDVFHSGKYRVFTQYAAATILRHWATMS